MCRQRGFRSRSPTKVRVGFVPCSPLEREFLIGTIDVDTELCNDWHGASDVPGQSK